MIGNYRPSLLAILLVLASTAFMDAQTIRPAAPDSTQPIGSFKARLPIIAQPPKPLPRPIAPHFQVRIPGAGFSKLVSASGMIFAGTVIRIERFTANQPPAIATVAVTFHIEHAIRGVRLGENIAISQWIGLWSSGQRYRVGERVFLFLYRPSTLGLTSSVGGPIGRFHIDSWGRVLLSPQHLSAFRTDPVLGGKSRLPFSDFASAVRHASEEE